MDKLILKRRVVSGDPATAVEFLVHYSSLSKTVVKEVMNKGGAWLQPSGKRSLTRLRRATKPLKTGDYLELHYDRNVLSKTCDPGLCLHQNKLYSVWYKPAGQLAQGNQYSDHCSLMRQVEIMSASNAEVYLIHRLDREAAGIMLFAHTKNSAAKLSSLFAQNQINKQYRVQTKGDIGKVKGITGEIHLPLDGKSAATFYEVISYNASDDISTLEVTLKTGRYHQIRRHFAMLGFPVIGDPRYGSENKNREGLRLIAYALSFLCPYTKRQVNFEFKDDKGF